MHEVMFNDASMLLPVNIRCPGFMPRFLNQQFIQTRNSIELD